MCRVISIVGISQKRENKDMNILKRLSIHQWSFKLDLTCSTLLYPALSILLLVNTSCSKLDLISKGRVSSSTSISAPKIFAQKASYLFTTGDFVTISPVLGDSVTSISI